MAVVESIVQKFRPVPTWRAVGWKAYLPVAVVGLGVAILVLPPIFILIQMALTHSGSAADGSYSLQNFARLFSDPRLYASAWNSFLFAALTTILSLIIGGGLAWIVERTDAPFRPLAYVTTVVSLGTPYILYVAAWVFLLGRIGPFNEFYRFLSGTNGNFINVYSIGGMVFIESIVWTPLIFMMMAATFRRSNAEMEEAARMSGASVFQTVTRISFRLAAPAILGIAMFVFIRSLESFDVPVLIGMPRQINLLTTDIYLEMTKMPPDMGYASAFACVMIGFVAILLYFYSKISKNADKYASVTGKGFRPRRFALGRWRWAGGAIIVGHFLLALVLPMVAILWSSLTPFVQSFSFRGLQNLSFMHYAAVFKQSIYTQMALNTLLVSAVAATCAVLITAIAGWLSVRRWPGGQILEQLVSVPLVFPGVVLGVAMMQLALVGPLPLYGTLWLISIAFVVRYMPYGMRYAYAGVIQIHRELEEAAGVAGAAQQTILRRIVAPLLAPSLVIAWFFIFLIGARELSIAVLLSGIHSKTIAVAIFDQWTNGDGGEVAAIGVIWTVCMTCCAALMHALARRNQKIFGEA